MRADSLPFGPHSDEQWAQLARYVYPEQDGRWVKHYDLALRAGRADPAGTGGGRAAVVAMLCGHGLPGADRARRTVRFADNRHRGRNASAQSAGARGRDAGRGPCAHADVGRADRACGRLPAGLTRQAGKRGRRRARGAGSGAVAALCSNFPLLYNRPMTSPILNIDLHCHSTVSDGALARGGGAGACQRRGCLGPDRPRRDRRTGRGRRGRPGTGHALRHRGRDLCHLGRPDGACRGPAVRPVQRGAGRGPAQDPRRPRRAPSASASGWPAWACPAPTRARCPSPAIPS